MFFICVAVLPSVYTWTYETVCGCFNFIKKSIGGSATNL